MRKVLFLFFLVFSISSVLMAQQEISGKVMDEDNQPLMGVNVIIKGTNVGTVTNVEGEFTIAAPSDAVLQFSFVGYNAEEVTVAGQTNIEISLVPDLTSLQEVVVTALGLKREKKALGYAVQDVKAEELTQAGDANIATSLQGKVAGVLINESGAGTGGSTRIEIRGASSLSDNNSPLIVVDGVPFNSSSPYINDENNQSDDQAGVWGGIETSGGIADINPEDIESISVLKGPNAAALYGSRAGNGVILITTKKGKSGTVSIDYSGNVTVSEIAYTLDLQDEYGQGQEGVYSPNSQTSWGPKMEGQMLESWTGELIPYEAQKDRIKDFSRNAVQQNHNLSLSTGSDKGTLRISLGRSNQDGIYEGHKVEKTNFDLRADYNLTKWLNLDTKASYFLTEGEGRPEMGFYSFVSYFNSMPMNIRSEDLDPGYDIIKGRHVEKLYTTANANNRNPYFQREQMYNNDERYRGFGYLAANIKFSEELKLKLKYGIDFYNEDRVDGYRYGDNVNSNRPDYNTKKNFFKEENYEFLLSYTKQINDFSLSLNAGGNRMYTYSNKLTSKSGLLPSEGYLFLDYGTNITSEEEFREQEVQSLYGFGQLGYRNMVFLDVTARNDWSSTLPEKNNSYFYPSVSLSGVVSEMVDLPDWFTFAKLRGSWAQVGKATEPYNIDMNYTVENWNFNLINGLVPEKRVNEDLKPEISSSYELGMDLKFLGNRIGLDMTYYNEETKNQILAVETNQSTGYSRKLINAGLISNEGVEILLNTTPVKTNDFSLNVNFNFAKNVTMVDELDDELKKYEFGAVGGTRFVANEGEKMGDIEGYRYARDENNNVIVDAQGLPTTPDSMVVIGNVQADFTAGISISANYKGFFLSTLITMQQGGDIFSATEQGAISSGTAKRTTENNRISFFYDGVTESGEENLTMISAQEYWNRLSGVSEEYMYDASHMKLRELAIGYRLPKNILENIPGNPIKRATVSLIGRNLFYFYKHTPGTVPDASSYSNSYAAQAYDFSPVPATRTYGFSVKLGF